MPTQIIATLTYAGAGGTERYPVTVTAVVAYARLRPPVVRPDEPRAYRVIYLPDPVGAPHLKTSAGVVRRAERTGRSPAAAPLVEWEAWQPDAFDARRMFAGSQPLGRPVAAPPRRDSAAALLVVLAHPELAIRHHAAAAIHDRLKGGDYGGPWRCILGVRSDPEVVGAVVLDVNDGGNACAVRERLLAVGYQVESLDHERGVFRVLPRAVAAGKAGGRRG